MNGCLLNRSYTTPDSICLSPTPILSAPALTTRVYMLLSTDTSRLWWIGLAEQGRVYLRVVGLNWTVSGTTSRYGVARRWLQSSEIDCILYNADSAPQQLGGACSDHWLSGNKFVGSRPYLGNGL